MLNDFLFRRALFTTNLESRKKQLTALREALRKEVKDGIGSYLDMDWLSAQRDKLILYGTPEQLREELQREQKYLPRIQTTQHHERYALIVALSKRLEDVEDRALLVKDQARVKEIAVEVDVPFTLTPAWLTCRVVSEDEEDPEQFGQEFYLEDEDALADYQEVLNQGERLIEAGKSLPKEMWGMRAVGHLPLDTQLLTKQALTKEEKLYREIMDLQQTLEGVATQSSEVVVDHTT